MTEDLRVALVVPRFDLAGHREYAAEELRRRCHDGKVDLVIFGENFFTETPLAQVVDRVGTMATDLRTPVLGGMWTTEQHIAAGFVNPVPREGDTERHLYLKHFSTPKTPYVLPEYGDANDPMFRPVQLRGRKFGVNICHDMFFGLLNHRFQLAGATALFDLTGENVQPTKWRCLGQGRSVEIHGAFFCTMDHKEGRPGKGFAFGYHDGVALRPAESCARPDGTGGFHVYLWHAERPDGPAVFTRPFSPQRYRDLTLGLGGSGGGDLQVKVNAAGVIVDGPRSDRTSDRWIGFNVRDQHVGVLTVPIASLGDPTFLYQHAPAPGRFQHHVVVYWGAERPQEPERCQILAALRAVEHRVAVVLTAGDLREVMKTDNYKKVQRLQEHDGVFGVNLQNLGGTWTTWRGAMDQADFPRYVALLDGTPPGQFGG